MTKVQVEFDETEVFFEAQVEEETDPSEADYIPGLDDGEAEPSDDEETSFE